MANQFDFFPLFYLRLLLDTQDMSTLEFGAYFRLLLAAWDQEPVGTLPYHAPQLARFARLTADDWSKVAPAVLCRFKDAREGRIISKKMQEVYANLLDAKMAKTERGRAGAKAMHEKKKRAIAVLKHAPAMPIKPNEIKPNEIKDPTLPSPLPNPAPIPPKSAENGERAWDESGGDELDKRIKFAIRDARYLNYSIKVHGEFRKIAEAVGFEEAQKLIAGAAQGPNVISPTAVALSRLGQTQARAIAGPSQSFTDQSKAKTRAAFAKAAERMGGSQ